MTSLDRVSRLISLKVQNLQKGSVPSTQDPDLVQSDVFAALGFGRLPVQAYMIGLARYTGDQKAIDDALSIAVSKSYEIFEQKQWSAIRAYQKPANDLVKSGELTKQQGEEMKTRLAYALPGRLAVQAFNALLGDDRCGKCNGVGSHGPIACAACSGSGKQRTSDKSRAKYCDLQYAAWVKTWVHRYRFIETEYKTWLNQFEIHVTERCK